jgi:hypothetical protein
MTVTLPAFTCWAWTLAMFGYDIPAGGLVWQELQPVGVATGLVRWQFWHPGGFEPAAFTATW